MQFRPVLGVAALCCIAHAQDITALIDKAPSLPVAIAEVPAKGLGFPSSVAMHPNGAIYILHRGEDSDPVVAVDRQGHVIRSWGKGQFKIPHAIRVDPQGNVWTVDAASSEVIKWSPEGEKLMTIAVGGQPQTQSPFNGTTDIAFAPGGRLFISDGYGNARILEYSGDGKRVREWGRPGNGPGEFRQPHAIAIDDVGTLYVADRQNGRLQRFDLNGVYQGEWKLGMVTSVDFHRGRLYIGTQRTDQPTSSDGWILQLDRKTGAVLGYTESKHGHHSINGASDGGILSGARPDSVLWFARRTQNGL